MRVLDDPVVGRLRYERLFWERDETVQLFGKAHVVRLCFRGDEDAPLEEGQKRAYAEFEAHRDVLLAEAEQAVYEYYQEISPEFREMLGQAADSAVPVVTATSDLASIVTPTDLVVPRATPEGGRMVGLVCDCTWDPGLGVGVKFVNEVVAEVGTQDIVL